MLWEQVRPPAKSGTNAHSAAKNLKIASANKNGVGDELACLVEKLSEQQFAGGARAKVGPRMRGRPCLVSCFALSWEKRVHSTIRFACGVPSAFEAQGLALFLSSDAINFTNGRPEPNCFPVCLIVCVNIHKGAISKDWKHAHIQGPLSHLY